jgi:hypothetical protein
MRVVQPSGLTTWQLLAWNNAMNFAEQSYLKLLSEGCTPEIAAGVLPRAMELEQTEH